MRPKQRMKSTLFSSFLQNSCFRLTFLVILSYHTFPVENREDSVKNTAILSFSGLNLFLVPICKTGVCPAKVSCCISNYFCRDTLPSFFFCFSLCHNQIGNNCQQDLQDHKADHNLTVGPFVFQADMVMQRCSCILRIAIFRKRSKNTLTRPIPPSTIITPAISRYKNGWRDCMARMAM